MLLSSCGQFIGHAVKLHWVSSWRWNSSLVVVFLHVKLFVDATLKKALTPDKRIRNLSMAVDAAVGAAQIFPP